MAARAEPRASLPTEWPLFSTAVAKGKEPSGNCQRHERAPCDPREILAIYQQAGFEASDDPDDGEPIPAPLEPAEFEWVLTEWGPDHHQVILAGRSGGMVLAPSSENSAPNHGGGANALQSEIPLPRRD